MSEDIILHIGRNYLKVSECLKLSSSFNLLYENHAKKIQTWYKKYKKIRDIRFNTLYTEYEKDTRIFKGMSYINIYLYTYNLKNLKDIVHEDYGFYKKSYHKRIF